MPFFKKHRPACRIFFATDVHGSEICFRKWISAGTVYEAKVLVLGGDITGKLVVPIVEEDGVYRAEIFGQVAEAHDDAGLENLIDRIRQMGRYEAIMSPQRRQQLESDDKAVDQLFREVMRASLARWVALADDRLDGSGITPFLMLGNDDLPELAEVLESGHLVQYGENRLLDVGEDFEILSFGCSPPTPWDSPREISEEEIADQLDQIVKQARNLKKTICNIHPPPRDTLLDQAPRLDKEMRPVVTGGGVDQMSVGSSAVRKFMLDYQPCLGLHGHVHESAGVDHLGATLCINPGSDYPDGILRGVIVDLAEDGAVSRWQFVQG